MAGDEAFTDGETVTILSLDAVPAALVVVRSRLAPEDAVCMVVEVVVALLLLLELLLLVLLLLLLLPLPLTALEWFAYASEFVCSGADSVNAYGSSCARVVD